MKKIMADSNFVVATTVIQVLPKQPAVVLSVKENLKGEFKTMVLPINMEGDAECKNSTTLPN